MKFLRLKTVKDLGLNDDQRMIYIYDLHYSHKEESVLDVLAANYIIPIFIPAGCTDLHQVCDVCINKPYKNGVATEFINTISNLYTKWFDSIDREELDIFKVNLSTGATNPLISGFVAGGMRNLKTTAMKESIAQCFKREGLLDEARLLANYERACIVLNGVATVPDEVEVEEDLGPTEDDEVQDIAIGLENTPFFEIEVNEDEKAADDLSDGNSTEDDNDNWEDIEDEKVEELPKKRQTTVNTMIGSVKKGKYSK